MLKIIRYLWAVGMKVKSVFCPSLDPPPDIIFPCAWFGDEQILLLFFFKQIKKPKIGFNIDKF